MIPIYPENIYNVRFFNVFEHNTTQQDMLHQNNSAHKCSKIKITFDGIDFHITVSNLRCGFKQGFKSSGEIWIVKAMPKYSDNLTSGKGD